MLTRLVPALIALVLTAAPTLAQSPAAACLADLHGTWRGPGIVLGRAIVMEQGFAPALGPFTEQWMRHLPSDTATQAQFEGRGFYRAVGTRAPDSVAGTWLDARGVTFPVEGQCRDGVLATRWGGTTERGRTWYLRVGDTLTVLDSVYPAAAPAREFGRSRLQRLPEGRGR